LPSQIQALCLRESSTVHSKEMRDACANITVISFAAASLLCFIALPSQARDFALVVGGGCTHKEPSTADDGTLAPQTHEHSRFVDSDGFYNPFRPEFELANEALKANGWSTQTFYATPGNNPSTNWEHPAGANWKSSDSDAIFKAMADLITKNKDFTENSQFLLVISAHGVDTPHHSVCLGRDKNGEDLWVPIRYFKEYLEIIAKLNHGKVAVLDDSCYSGQTVDAFKASPFCTMSSASPHAQGEMSSIGNFMFSLGLPRDAQILHTVPLQPPPEEGTPDLDANGVITASEAFEYARMRFETDDLPSVSDCLLSDAHLKANLDRISTALLLAKANDGENERRQTQDEASQPGVKCAMQELATGFRSIYETAKNTKESGLIARVEEELHRIDPRESRSIDGAISDLQSAVQGYGDALDQAIALRPAPGKQISLDSLHGLKESLKALERQKHKLMGALRPALYFACAVEKSRRSPPVKSPCDKFVLFRGKKRPAKP
jgi:hypothetical protein